MNLNPILDRASSSALMDYHPRAVVDAVNALQPLGKDGALDAIEAYLQHADQTADPRTGLFLVMRVLFEVPADPGHQPAMKVGGSMPAPPKELSALPLFPILLIDDIPLLLVSGYVLGGEPEPLSAHITYYRAHGVVRARLLAPGAPEGVLARYQQAYQAAYHAAPSPREQAFVEGQLAKMK